MGYKVKKIYVGTQQVRPAIATVEYDFTQGTQGFAYSGDNTYVSSYGQNQDGLYIVNMSYVGRGLGGFNIPTAATSKVFKKAEFLFSGNNAGYGVGFGTVEDSKRIRLMGVLRVNRGTQNTSSSSVPTASNTTIKFTIDLENKLLYSDVNSVTATLTDNAISAFKTDRLSGIPKLALYTMDTANSNVYMKNLKIYY